MAYQNKENKRWSYFQTIESILKQLIKEIKKSGFCYFQTIESILKLKLGLGLWDISTQFPDY